MSVHTAVCNGEASATVIRMGRNTEGREVWTWDISYGSEYQTGDDLRTGVGMTATPEEMLRTLAGFLSAHAESSEGGECADLFAISREATAAVADAIYCEVGWE